jgi:MFS family permease
VLVPYVVKNDLGGDAGDVGLVYAAAGLGAILAALIMGQRSLPRRHITVMYAAWTVGALFLAAYGLATHVWQAMLAGVVRGAGMTCGLIIWTTLMQTRVPRHLLGRVTSVDWFMSIGLVPISFALTGPIAESLGSQETLIWAGVLGASVTLAFLFLPGMRATEQVQESHEPRSRTGLMG